MRIINLFLERLRVLVGNGYYDAVVEEGALYLIPRNGEGRQTLVEAVHTAWHSLRENVEPTEVATCDTQDRCIGLEVDTADAILRASRFQNNELDPEDQPIRVALFWAVGVVQPELMCSGA